MEKMKEIPKTDKKGVVDALFSVVAHFGFVKSRRHPSAKPFIFGSKNNIEIFDLAKSSRKLSLSSKRREKRAPWHSGSVEKVKLGKPSQRQVKNLKCLMSLAVGSVEHSPTFLK